MAKTYDGTPDLNPAYRRFRDYRPPSILDRIVAFVVVAFLMVALGISAYSAFSLVAGQFTTSAATR